MTAQQHQAPSPSDRDAGGAPSLSGPYAGATPAPRSAGPLPRALGLFSLGLGAAQLLVPGRFVRGAGLEPGPETCSAMRGVGLRELAVAPGLLLRRSPRAETWARVAGDVMDLLMLLGALDAGRGGDRERVRTTTAALGGLTLLDVVAARRTGRRTRPLRMIAATTVNRPATDVYAYWRDLQNLPTFMAHLEQVRTGPGSRSRWTAKAPLGRVRWEAEIVEDLPAQRLAWRSVGRTKVHNRGAVHFTPAPGDRGTEVRVELHYDVPGGRAGAKLARLLGEEPHQQVEDDLRRFKQVLETGEVVRSDGTPEGSRARRHLVQRPAAPLSR